MEDTIAAISTALGVGAISIIRISGPDSLNIVNNLFDIKILNYNIDLTQGKTKLIAFLKLGESLGIPYIESYKAYKYAEKISLEKRLDLTVLWIIKRNK